MENVRTEYYEVVHPPTSGEVREEAFEAIRQKSGRLCVRMMSRQEVPPPEEKGVCFRIRRTFHPEDGRAMTIGGTNEEGNTVNVHTHEEDGQPATANMVVKDQS